MNHRPGPHPITRVQGASTLGGSVNNSTSVPADQMAFVRWLGVSYSGGPVAVGKAVALKWGGTTKWQAELNDPGPFFFNFDSDGRGGIGTGVKGDDFNISVDAQSGETIRYCVGLSLMNNLPNPNAKSTTYTIESDPNTAISSGDQAVAGDNQIMTLLDLTVGVSGGATASYPIQAWVNFGANTHFSVDLSDAQPRFFDFRPYGLYSGVQGQDITVNVAAGGGTITTRASYTYA